MMIRICQYVPTTTPRDEEEHCPDGNLKQVAGKLVCTDDEMCPHGQNEVYNEDGTSICVIQELTGASLCLEGTVHKYTCITSTSI